MQIYKISADKGRLQNELSRIGVDSYALNMDRKGLAFNLCIKDIAPAAANIIKQEAIASGMDAALKRGSVSCSIDKTDVLLMGAVNLYERLIKRLKHQPFGLKLIGEELSDFIKQDKAEDKYFLCRDTKLALKSPKIMGILNLTPDSFSDGGLLGDFETVKVKIDSMIDDGADIIDIGGMSSRPGSDPVTWQEEVGRIDGALEYAIVKGAVVSIDTCYPETAEFALKKGAHIINDITGLKSRQMRKICAEYQAGACIMHMAGNPKEMQNSISYDNLIYDIKNFFDTAIHQAIEDGVNKNSIMIDLGFGFGKTVEQNYALLKYLDEFKSFGLPILVGISRKSMIGAVTGKDVTDRQTGTTALNTAAIMNGASFIRTHDVKAGVETAQVIDYLKKAKDK